MSRVLLVEDEHIYRDTLARALTRNGHRVLEASSARSAIRTGCAERPEVLVADWMLRDDHPGIDVARALQVLDPQLQTVLITGFPSQDLRDELARLGACELVEKPFRLEELQAAIARAAAERRVGPVPRGSGVLDLGVLLVEPGGEIAHANAAAQLLLGRSPLPGCILTEVLTEGPDPTGPESAKRWIGVSAAQPGLPRLALRARPETGMRNRLFALCRFEDAALREDPRVRLLLDLDDGRVAGWRYSARVLVIDRDPTARRYALAQLQGAGCAALTADGPELALQILAADYGIHFALIDAECSREELSETTARLRALRPDLRVVATGARRDSAEELGVDAVVPRPWSLEELSSILDALSR